MALSRGFKSSSSADILSAIVLCAASLLLLVACGDTSTPSQGENSMTTNVSSSCSGQNKEKADRYVINAFNYGYKIGLGIPTGPNELGMIQQEYAQLSPACLQYVESISVRLQRMLEGREIRNQIDKLPW